jgi:hypothetical protein
VTIAQSSNPLARGSSLLLDRITKGLPRLYLPLLLLLVAAYAWRPLEGGSDFWAHAAVGRWIVAHGRVPHAPLFLWSEPHSIWVAHSWLCQLLFYNLLTYGGTLSVAIFNVALPVAVFYLLWRVWKQESDISFWAPLLFSLAIWASAPRFMPRPELISALFLTVLLAFLVAWSKGRFDDWLLWRSDLNLSFVAAPLITLFALWVNLHALVATGLVVLWLAVVAENAQAHLGKQRFQSEDTRAQNRARARALLVVAVLASCATLLNPYALSYWGALDFLKPGGQARWIDEWKPFWQPDAMLWQYPLAMAVLFAAALAAWRANPLRRWSHLLWLFFSAAIFLRSRRMLFISAILFIVVLAANAHALESPVLWRGWRRMVRGNIFDPIPAGLRLVTRAGILVILITWVLAAASRHMPLSAQTWEVTMRAVPEGAARQILSGKLPRRLYNDYEDSSYLQWRLNGFTPGTKEVPTRGRYPLFIDLLNAYPDRLLAEYLEILEASPAGLKALASRKINCVVLGNHHWYAMEDKVRVKSPLVAYLDRSGWKRVFRDRESIIWVKQPGK